MNSDETDRCVKRLSQYLDQVINDLRSEGFTSEAVDLQDHLRDLAEIERRHEWDGPEERAAKVEQWARRVGFDLGWARGFLEDHADPRRWSGDEYDQWTREED